MANTQILLAFVLIYCGVCHAAFCSEDELAGKCFDDKIKPMAIAAVVVAFILGISTILLAVALYCKAKRRHQAKILVYRQPYKADSLRGTRQNDGFESAAQYHVKRPVPYEVEQPTYIVTRNAGHTPDRVSGALLAENGRSHSPASSGMLWVPNGDEKTRTNPIYK